jgi:hypothetical protein
LISDSWREGGREGGREGRRERKRVPPATLPFAINKEPKQTIVIQILLSATIPTCTEISLQFTWTNFKHFAEI